MLASTTLFTSVLLGIFKDIGMINNSLKAADFYREYEETLKNNSVLSDSNRLSEIDLDFSTASFKFENVSFCYPGASDFT